MRESPPNHLSLLRSITYLVFFTHRVSLLLVESSVIAYVCLIHELRRDHPFLRYKRDWSALSRARLSLVSILQRRRSNCDSSAGCGATEPHRATGSTASRVRIETAPAAVMRLVAM